MKLKSGLFLILASLVIAVIGTLPWLINKDRTLLLPALILGGILFLAGAVSMFKRAYRKMEEGPVGEAKSHG